MIRGRLVVFLAVAGAWPGTFGCSHRQPASGPVGFEGRPATFAVVPVRDLSGGAWLDPLVLTDLLASELAQVEQIGVVPVNQTLAVMHAQGWRVLESPEQAAALSRMLGADGVVVVAVTQYDPYDPPNLGLIAELYTVPARPVPDLSGEQIDRLPAPLTSRPAARSGPVRQVQRVFDASATREQEGIRAFAQRRSGDGAPDWQEYMRSQRLFLRYCCWRTVTELIGAPAAGATPGGTRNGGTRSQ